MMKLGLVLLAASAAVVPVTAQTVPDPDPFYGIPQISLALPGAAAVAATPAPAAPQAAMRPAPAMTPRAGHSWQERRMAAPAPVMAQMRQQMRTPRPAMHRPPTGGMHRPGTGGMHQPPMGGAHRPPRWTHQPGTHRPPRWTHRPGMHRPPMHRRFGHIRRGGFVPQFWWGPQFVVPNWSMWGWQQPLDGGRWIRYYDDALLIDRSGRVLDGRYGWNWDRDGDRWGYDDQGIPAYVGDGDYEPDEDAYEGADYDDGDYADDYDDAGAAGCGDRCGPVGPPPPPVACANPCTSTYSGPGPMPGYGYSYGCGTCGPVVVTETITTTTTPVVETRTYYEYVTERAAPRRHHRKPVRRARPTPPRPGERG
ncbi:MAG TPA: RcnB family protein [Allosphingosinicella sp.]|jgi:Ni/Co efflux regulator RcnB